MAAGVNRRSRSSTTGQFRQRMAYVALDDDDQFTSTAIDAYNLEDIGHYGLKAAIRSEQTSLTPEEPVDLSWCSRTGTKTASRI